MADPRPQSSSYFRGSVEGHQDGDDNCPKDSGTVPPDNDADVQSKETSWSLTGYIKEKGSSLLNNVMPKNRCTINCVKMYQKYYNDWKIDWEFCYNKKLPDDFFPGSPGTFPDHVTIVQKMYEETQAGNSNREPVTKQEIFNATKDLLQEISDELKVENQLELFFRDVEDEKIQNFSPKFLEGHAFPGFTDMKSHFKHTCMRDYSESNVKYFNNLFNARYSRHKARWEHVMQIIHKIWRDMILNFENHVCFDSSGINTLELSGEICIKNMVKTSNVPGLTDLSERFLKKFRIEIHKENQARWELELSAAQEAQNLTLSLYSQEMSRTALSGDDLLTDLDMMSYHQATVEVVLQAWARVLEKHSSVPWREGMESLKQELAKQEQLFIRKNRDHLKSLYKLRSKYLADGVRIFEQFEGQDSGYDPSSHSLVSQEILSANIKGMWNMDLQNKIQAIRKEVRHASTPVPRPAESSNGCSVSDLPTGDLPMICMVLESNYVRTKCKANNGECKKTFPAQIHLEEFGIDSQELELDSPSIQQLLGMSKPKQTCQIARTSYEIGPVDLLAMYFNRIRRVMENELGIRVTRCLFLCPGIRSCRERQLLKMSLNIAGFTIVCLIPCISALAQYRKTLMHEPHSAILVYGTATSLESAVVEISEQTATVKTWSQIQLSHAGSWNPCGKGFADAFYKMWHLVVTGRQPDLLFLIQDCPKWKMEALTQGVLPRCWEFRPDSILMASSYMFSSFAFAHLLDEATFDYKWQNWFPHDVDVYVNDSVVVRAWKKLNSTTINPKQFFSIPSCEKLEIRESSKGFVDGIFFHFPQPTSLVLILTVHPEGNLEVEFQSQDFTMNDSVGIQVKTTEEYMLPTNLPRLKQKLEPLLSSVVDKSTDVNNGTSCHPPTTSSNAIKDQDQAESSGAGASAVLETPRKKLEELVHQVNERMITTDSTPAMVKVEISNMLKKCEDLLENPETKDTQFEYYFESLELYSGELQ